MEEATGTRVYVPDPNDKVSWLPATIVRHVDEKSVIVRLDDDDDDENSIITIDLSTVPNSILPLQNTHTTSVEDMITLSHLHEASIAYNLKSRFHHNTPYTFVNGASIVIAINPYKWHDELYSKTIQDTYDADNVNTTSILPPHIYATSANAYYGMKQQQKAQSILVSGESGAGKTESVKLIMTHLASLSSHDNTNIVSRVLESNPLLESFGNAKTCRNDNSSRFGKYCQLEFKESCLTGATVTTYLLEKSRVVFQSEGESNYHIFYQIILQEDGGDFNYLRRDDHHDLSDSDKLRTTKKQMSMIGISDNVQEQLFNILRGILYVGQITFVNDTESNDSESNDVVTPENELLVTKAASYLGITDHQSLVTSLVVRTIRARSEVYSVPLTSEQAHRNRDALAKELYARVFSYVVSCINHNISSKSQQHCNNSTIACLDIFGFEKFESNSFEQLMINYANERLQAKFTMDVLTSVQKEYKAEGITSWEYIPHRDNNDILSTIYSSTNNRITLVSLLNEECIRPKGSDLSFASKVLATHSSSNVVKAHRMSKMHFCLSHYAGDVWYDTSSFVEKNKDLVQSDVITCLSNSTSNDLLQSLFPTKKHPSSSSNKSSSSLISIDSTVSSKFTLQLNDLMTLIGKTNVHYVRCIKPNDFKSPEEFNMSLVITQLQCAGVVEAIRITRAAFPNKLKHAEFVQRYDVILPPAPVVTSKPPVSRTVATAATEMATRLFSLSEDTDDDDTLPYAMGKTLIYFRKGVLEALEDKRMTIVCQKTIVIQSFWRMISSKSKYKVARESIITIQSTFRTHQCKRTYYKILHGVLRIQSYYRGYKSRCLTSNMIYTKRIVFLQSHLRAAKSRKEYLNKRRAVIKLQSVFRSMLESKRYRTLLSEHQKSLALDSEIKGLSSKLERMASPRSNNNNNTEVVENIGGFSDKTLLDESGRMLELMRTELQKLRSTNESLLLENQKLKTESSKIKQAYTNAGSSFAALNQHNKQQSKANLRLMATHASLIKSQAEKMKKYQSTIKELKTELRMQRYVYDLEVDNRVHHNNVVMDIISVAESREDVIPAEVLNEMRTLAMSNAPGPSGNVARSSVSVNSSEIIPPPASPPFEDTTPPSLPEGTRETWVGSSNGAVAGRESVYDNDGRRKSRISRVFKKMFKNDK